MVKLKLKYTNSNKEVKEFKYDILDVFPVGDGFIGIEIIESHENFDSLVENILNKDVFTEYGDSTHHFNLASIDMMPFGNIMVLFEKQH